MSSSAAAAAETAAETSGSAATADVSESLLTEADEDGITIGVREISRRQVERAIPDPDEVPKAADWIDRKRWMTEEERLAEWYWLDALGVPPDSDWLDHGVRQGKIPTWLSEEAVQETEKIAEMGLCAQSLFLKEAWLPFLLAKREEIKKTRAGNLLKLDLEAMAEA